MSDRESQQASIDASEASLPAENGSREVANDPPPLGRAEESVSDAGVAARTRFQRRLQNVAGADIIDPARIADPPTRSDPPEESTSARAAESSAPNAASVSLQGVSGHMVSVSIRGCRSSLPVFPRFWVRILCLVRWRGSRTFSLP